LVAPHGPIVTASAGLELVTAPLPPIGARVDTLMIAGGQGVEAAAADPTLVDWVRERARRARRTASVCTGAFLLAASGVLDR
jgi:transcriptional regulator GlxA family with amidase domain